MRIGHRAESGAAWVAVFAGWASSAGASPAPQGIPIRFGDPQEHTLQEWFDRSGVDPSITTPDSTLGQPLGTRAAHDAEIGVCFERWSQESERIEVARFGQSHEGRPLLRAVISDPANLKRLEAIRADLARLADPRGLAATEADAILARTPACAWLGYSIHGDELSGCDAALEVAYQLLARTDDAARALLADLVIVVDPCQNPDGRERILHLVEQSSGFTPNLDYASMQRGRWPHGRGNHYLFDMNRDWMAGTQPETRARWKEIRKFHPQLLIDAHEMGAFDSFLFYPQNRPHNPHLPGSLQRWQKQFGDDQAGAFDRRGWSYYTREWADAWGPFYTDAWASLNGAIGILYEQANTTGVALTKPTGRVFTYREAVAQQAVSSLANLATLKEYRAAVLSDYLAERRAAVDPATPGNDRMLVVLKGMHEDRERRLAEILIDQGILVQRTSQHFTAAGVEGPFGKREPIDVPPGALLVRACQPQSRLVQSFLRFDVRMDRTDLGKEREELERKDRSLHYDDTAWSLPLAFGLDAFWCRADEVPAEPLEQVEPAAGAVVPPAEPAHAPVAWIVDGRDDRSLRFAVAAFDSGLVLHAGDKRFTSGGHVFERGSLVVRAQENGTDAAQKIERVAQRAGVEVYATGSGRSPDDGPDLGGGHFHLLSRPKVALLGNAPVDTDAYGHCWHWLDVELGLSVSLLDAAQFGGYDLRRYNVLVLPPADLAEALGDHVGLLRKFVEQGGTLIAAGRSAAALTKKPFELASTRLRADVLVEEEAFREAVERERAARTIEIDEREVWGDPPGTVPEKSATETEKFKTAESQPPADSPTPAEPAEKPQAPADSDQKAKGRERAEQWARRFAPRGVFLRATPDEEHWLTVGSVGPQAVFFQGSDVFWARAPVATPLRFDRADTLRLSGLVWPEARSRIADSAAVTVERVGNGQLILFATAPVYRGSTRNSARWFANAVVYGPGLGANQPVE